MSCKRHYVGIASGLAIAALVSGCASSSQLQEPITITVNPKIQKIELEGAGLLWRVGAAFEDAAAEPKTRVGDTIAVGAVAMTSNLCGSPEAAIIPLFVGTAGVGIGIAERGATFAWNLAVPGPRGGSSTLAEIQISEAARHSNAAAMFAEFLPVSAAGDLLVIVRSVGIASKQSGYADLTITVEAVRRGVDGGERVLAKYVHKAPYRAEHPDLVAKRHTPTLAIRAGIAVIAAEIQADFNIASSLSLARVGR